jgi:hypothetical protein
MWQEIVMVRVVLLAVITVLSLATSVRADSRTTTPPAATEVRPLPPKPPTALELMVNYQRVGRALLKLQDQRGANDCGDLMPRFRTIKLEPALATVATRAELAAELTELAGNIERMRGIKVADACLKNPLADACK